MNLKTCKRFFLPILWTAIGGWLLLVAAIVVKNGITATNKAGCCSNIVQAGFAVRLYQEDNGVFPEFRDKDGNATWSWRTCYFLSQDKRIKVDLNKPWNDPENITAVRPVTADYERAFTCCSLSPKEKRSTYVAVTGPGTLWTETNAGRINDPQMYPDMIFLVETTQPKNYWAQPGDDISPEEVIRLYETDPGLLKDSKRSFLSTNHLPKYFITMSGGCYSFDEIKDVEELKKRLVVEPPKP